MPKYIALEADSLRLHLLTGSTRTGGVRLEKSLILEEEKPLTPANAAEIGARLKESLREEKIAAAPLLVSVGRDRIVLKEIKIPVVPEHEEPAVVRFQALREFTESSDEIVIDYTPLPAANGERRVQVVSVRKEYVQACKKMAEAAGLPLKAVAPRSFALLAGLQQAIAQNLVAAPESAGATAALLVRGERWGELIIQRSGCLILARSLATQSLSTDAALIGELRRNLAIHANQNPDAPVKALYLPEPDSPGGLRERLQTSLDLPVYSYEPLAGVPAPDGPRGTLAGLAGMLALAQGPIPINFAKPREPKPPRDPNKRLLAFAGAGLVVLLLALGAAGAVHIVSKERQIANLDQKNKTTEGTLKQLDPDVKKLKALDEWAANDVNWLDELYEASAHAKDVQKMRITTFSAAPIDNRAAKSKFVATVAVKGVMTDHQPVAGLVQELVKEPAYRIGPTTEKRNTMGIDRLRFREEFNFKYEVEKRPPEKYTSKFTADPPPKRGRGGEPGMMMPDFGGMFP